MPQQITSEQVARIMALVGDGRSKRYAARVVGVPESTARRAIARYEETGHCRRRAGSGRSRCTTVIDDRFIRLQTLRNRFHTAVQTNIHLRQVRGRVVSDRTVIRRLKEVNLRSRIPATAPRLLARHRRARRNFAREHSDWNEQNFSRILFVDESRFCLFSSDGRQRVWRRVGERYEQSLFSTKESFGGGSVMVWGGISLEARTELYVLPGNSLTANRYIENILQDYVIPFAPFIGNDFILVHDNARPHTAHIVNEYLDEVGIDRMIWPAKSPDMNPIEHVWDEMGRRIRSRNRVPDTLDTLGEALIEEWNNIPQINISNLIRSMPRRIETLIRARGGNTRY